MRSKMSDLDSYEEIEIEEEYFSEEEEGWNGETQDIKDEHFSPDIQQENLTNLDEKFESDDDCFDLCAGEISPPEIQPEINSAAANFSREIEKKSPAREKSPRPEKKSPRVEFDVPLLFCNNFVLTRPDYGKLASRVRSLERKLFEINLIK